MAEAMEYNPEDFARTLMTKSFLQPRGFISLI